LNTFPLIFQDRSSLSGLERDYPDVIKKLREFRLGKTGTKGTVHFCGLAWADNDTACVFAPRRSLSNDTAKNQALAKLTMRTLARYSRDMSDRLGVQEFGEGNTALLAVISELVADFVKYGIHAERVRYRTRNNGKPEWARTVIREMAMIGTDGNIVYPNIRTIRSVDSNDTLLAKVQAEILTEITLRHSWWLDGLKGREVQLKQYSSPETPRFLWAQHLRSLLPELFATRAINLTQMLIAYLDETKGRGDGDFLFGVEDFHTIWEHMLRKVLQGVDVGWNARLPRPAYVHTTTGKLDVQARGMQTDIVLRDANGLRVVDAKYYDALGPNSTPSWPDIVKQLFYDIALRSVASGESVSGCFVFPAPDGGGGKYSSVEMRHRNGTKAVEFPEINCYYISIMEVMSAYVGGRRITLE
jgi:hypothetical protein